MGSEVGGRASGDANFLRGAPGFFPRLLPEAVWAVLRGRRRSLAADCRRLAALLDPPPRVEGLEKVPPRGPFLLVANHFQARGIWIGWLVAALTDAVARARAPGQQEIHWLVLSEWRWFQLGRRWVPNPFTALVFARAARVWGLVPTPSNPADVAGRAAALREVLGYLGRRGRGDEGPGEPVGIFPEGTATVALGPALPGTGAFLQRLSSRGVPLLPVGIFQEEGVLVLRFGAPFFVGDPPPGLAEDVDDWARRRVMVAIGRLLPRDLWGHYAEALAVEAQG